MRAPPGPYLHTAVRAIIEAGASRCVFLKHSGPEAPVPFALVSPAREQTLTGTRLN